MESAEAEPCRGAPPQPNRKKLGTLLVAADLPGDSTAGGSDGAALTGLQWRAERIPSCPLPTDSTVDPASEVAAPITRNNAFSPSFRASKSFTRRETVYLRQSADTPTVASPDGGPPPIISSADEGSWTLTDQMVSLSKRAGVVDGGSPNKKRNSVSFGSTISISNDTEGGREAPQAVFDSNFECGNLLRAERVVRQNPLSSAPSTASMASADFRVQPLEEYLLYMEEEPCRKNGCQWFFFRTKYLSKRKRYSFSLCNFYKSKASFTKGMRPVFFSSVAHAIDRSSAWKRIGDDITYKRNTSGSCRGSESSSGTTTQYTLSFTFDVPHDNDVCYFAFSIPYSLTRLQSKIRSWMEDPIASPHLEVYEMCRTIAGNPCPLLLITDQCSDFVPLCVLPWERERVRRQKAADKASKQALLARQREEEARAIAAAQEAERKVEDDRVFYIGKQKMHMSLGVLDWETELDEGEVPAGEGSSQKETVVAAESKICVDTSSTMEGDNTMSSGPPMTRDDGVLFSPTRVHRSKKRKPVVVVSARVHPGETVSSLMCEGMVEYLLSDAPSAIQLRERCVFLVVPMLNPDGVVNGFYRTNLSGTDLNRCWDRPSELHHPTVHALKAIIHELQKTDRIISYFDFHGHSHKKGIFFYGTRMYPSYASVYNQVVHGSIDTPYACLSKDTIAGRGNSSLSTFMASCSDQRSGEGSLTTPSSAFTSAWKPFRSVSPVDLVLSVGTCTRLVNLRHCTAAFHRVARFKGVARYVVSEELEVPMSFTIEASFHAGCHGPYKKRHFRSVDYMRFGRVLGFCIYKTNFEPASGVGETVSLVKDRPGRLVKEPKYKSERDHDSDGGRNEVDRLFRPSDDDEYFAEHVKEHAQPFKTRWYASISNSSDFIAEEQDDSDDDADTVVPEPQSDIYSSDRPEIASTLPATVESLAIARALSPSVSARLPHVRYYTDVLHKKVFGSRNDDEYPGTYGSVACGGFNSSSKSGGKDCGNVTIGDALCPGATKAAAYTTDGPFASAPGTPSSQGSPRLRKTLVRPRVYVGDTPGSGGASTASGVQAASHGTTKDVFGTLMPAVYVSSPLGQTGAKPPRKPSTTGDADSSSTSGTLESSLDPIPCINISVPRQHGGVIVEGEVLEDAKHRGVVKPNKCYHPPTEDHNDAAISSGSSRAATLRRGATLEIVASHGSVQKEVSANISDMRLLRRRSSGRAESPSTGSPTVDSRRKSLLARNNAIHDRQSPVDSHLLLQGMHLEDRANLNAACSTVARADNTNSGQDSRAGYRGESTDRESRGDDHMLLGVQLAGSEDNVLNGVLHVEPVATPTPPVLSRNTVRPHVKRDTVAATVVGRSEGGRTVADTSVTQDTASGAIDKGPSNIESLGSGEFNLISLQNIDYPSEAGDMGDEPICTDTHKSDRKTSFSQHVAELTLRKGRSSGGRKGHSDNGRGSFLRGKSTTEVFAFHPETDTSPGRRSSPNVKNRAHRRLSVSPRTAKQPRDSAKLPSDIDLAALFFSSCSPEVTHVNAPTHCDTAPGMGSTESVKSTQVTTTGDISFSEALSVHAGDTHLSNQRASPSHLVAKESISSDVDLQAVPVAPQLPQLCLNVTKLQPYGRPTDSILNEKSVPIHTRIDSTGVFKVAETILPQNNTTITVSCTKDRNPMPEIARPVTNPGADDIMRIMFNDELLDGEGIEDSGIEPPKVSVSVGAKVMHPEVAVSYSDASSPEFEFCEPIHAASAIQNSTVRNDTIIRDKTTIIEPTRATNDSEELPSATIRVVVARTSGVSEQPFMSPDSPRQTADLRCRRSSARYWQLSNEKGHVGGGGVADISPTMRHVAHALVPSSLDIMAAQTKDIKSDFAEALALADKIGSSGSDSDDMSTLSTKKKCTRLRISMRRRNVS